MKLAMTKDDGEYHVWAMLDDGSLNHVPKARGESFIIGMGSTPQCALDDARRTLFNASVLIKSLTDDPDGAEAMGVEVVTAGVSVR